MIGLKTLSGQDKKGRLNGSEVMEAYRDQL